MRICFPVVFYFRHLNQTHQHIEPKIPIQMVTCRLYCVLECFCGSGLKASPCHEYKAQQLQCCSPHYPNHWPLLHPLILQSSGVQ
ncbi:hypothetical protein EMCRGX_G005489 [Ephydatia muelleri]